MNGAEFLAWASLFAMALLGMAMALSTIRVVIGPSFGDRVLALDLMTNIALAFVAAFAIHTGVMLYLDIALALGLVGFLSALAFARFMLVQFDSEQTNGDRTGL